MNGDSSGAVSAVTVSSTAVLGGAGAIGGLTTLSGTLAPGADAITIGLLTFTGSLSLGSSSRTLREISGTGRGTGYHALNVAGLAYCGSGAAGRLSEIDRPRPVGAGVFPSQ